MTARSRKTKTTSEPLVPDIAPDDVLSAGTESEPESDAPTPTPEPSAPEPEKEADTERDSVTLIYRGTSDVISHGPFRIRPGQPVIVPSDIAEELLTWPHEPFEKVESQE